MAGKTVQVINSTDGFDVPPLGREDGTAYGYYDRLQVGTTPDGKLLTDYADWEARDIFDMLARDYKAKQIENVLSLPVMSAEHNIVPGEGDSGEAQWLKDYWHLDPLQGGCRTSLNQIIGLCTSAFSYKRAYFEKVWGKGVGKFAGKLVYADVAYRPQTTCRVMRDPINGRLKGFEQEAYYIGPGIKQNDKWPIRIPPNRAFIYTNGTRRDPINGVSDMEVAFWAYKTKQKILMLWMQFLQGVALPRIITKANDQDTATEIAREIARMKGSGVLPVAAPGGPQSVGIDVLDASGKGAEQFQAVITWLDACVADSVLAGFLNLTGASNTASAGGGTGSYALSKDASDFFIQAMESKTRELEDQIRLGLFAPLIYHNFGPNAVVPHLQFEPLNDIDKATAVDLLKSSMAAPPGGPVPSSFVAALAEQVGDYVGLNGADMKADFKASFDAAAAQAKSEALAKNAPGAASPVGQAVAGLAGAVQAAHEAVNGTEDPKRADKLRKQFGQAHAADSKARAQQSKATQALQDMVAHHTDAALAAKTSGEKNLGLPARNKAPKQPNHKPQP